MADKDAVGIDELITRNKSLSRVTVDGVRLEELTAAQVGILGETPRELFTATAVALSICDADWKRQQPSAHQIEALSRSSSRAIAPLYDAVSRLSGLTKDSIEEAEGN